MIGYSTWDAAGKYHDITWLDGAYSAIKEGRLWYWIDSRHPSRMN